MERSRHCLSDLPGSAFLSNLLVLWDLYLWGEPDDHWRAPASSPQYEETRTKPRMADRHPNQGIAGAEIIFTHGNRPEPEFYLCQRPPGKIYVGQSGTGRLLRHDR